MKYNKIIKVFLLILSMIAFFNCNDKLSTEDTNTFYKGVKLLKKKDYTDAEKIFNRLGNKYPESDINNLMLGKVNLYNKKYDKAITYLRKSLNANKYLLTARYTLAQSYFMNNKITEAEKEFLKVLETDKDNINANLYLGKIALMKNDDVTALFYLTNCIDNIDFLSDVYRNIGDVYYDREDYIKSENIYKIARELTQNINNKQIIYDMLNEDTK